MPRVAFRVTFRPPQSQLTLNAWALLLTSPYNGRAPGELMSAPVSDDLNSTLNLAKTDFAMKANLPVNEPKTLARWDEMRLYSKIRESRARRLVYVVHAGHPYAT